MSLNEAIHSVMRAKGITNSNLLGNPDRQRDRTTMYRLLNGDTADPKVSTLIEVCTGLNVTPNEILELSGTWVPRKRSTDPTDIGLRTVFSRVQSLPDDRKELALRLLLSFVSVLEESDGRSGS
jgi:hypothetical protein